LVLNQEASGTWLRGLERQLTQFPVKTPSNDSKKVEVEQRESAIGARNMLRAEACPFPRFGRHSHDELSILSPLSQCCM
jgi:hypothetical protein